MEETRASVVPLLGYSDVFGEKRIDFSPTDFLKEVPSISLIQLVAWVNISLLNKDNKEKASTTQIYILRSILNNAPIELRNVFEAPLNSYYEQGHLATYFYIHSNLKYYELIFRNWNHKASRNLTNEECILFLKTYLHINTIIGDSIKLDNAEWKQALESNSIHEIMTAKFIHQTNFRSNPEYFNQIARGKLFLEYLNNSPLFKDYFKRFLAWYKVKNINEYLYNILCVFTVLSTNENNGTRHIAKLKYQRNDLNHKFLQKISINDRIVTYIDSIDFTDIRDYPLYYIGDKTYLILNINFLVDKLYKNIVFAFNKYIKEQGFKDDFFGIKAKEFTEEIFFYKIIERCFKQDYILFSGKQIFQLLNKKEELSDYYVRSDNKIALFELKDCLLDSKSKHNGIAEILYSKLDQKFWENQNHQPKGALQLASVIKKISAGLQFDDIKNKNLTIYPIITYTDLSFGFDGINFNYVKRFNDIIIESNLPENIQVKPITFINLSFFEFYENWLSDNTFNLFELLDAYYEHIRLPEFELVPFEVFLRKHADSYNIPYNLSEFGIENLKGIMGLK